MLAVPTNVVSVRSAERRRNAFPASGACQPLNILAGNETLSKKSGIYISALASLFQQAEALGNAVMIFKLRNKYLVDSG